MARWPTRDMSWHPASIRRRQGYGTVEEDKRRQGKYDVLDRSLCHAIGDDGRHLEGNVDTELPLGGIATDCLLKKR